MDDPGLWLTLSMLAGFVTTTHAATVEVGRFTQAAPTPPAPWEVVRLDQKIAPTAYRIVEWDGVPAIEASAKNSMALLGRPVEVDLSATPILCWRWRIDRVVQSADMATKAGDDYAARVYVAFDLPPETLGLGTRLKLQLARSIYGDIVPDAALNYVWDNKYPVGTRRPNAYTDRTRMIVQRSGNGEAGKWVVERVNVLDDAAQAFGAALPRVRLLAVAADTDNTGETVRSGFADLHFVGREAACVFPGDGKAGR